MTKKKIIRIGIASALCVFLAAAVFLAVKSSKSSDGREQGGMLLDRDAADWDASGLEDGGGTGIRIPGYGTVYFPAGERNVPITLYNPAENRCDFRFELYIGEQEELVYASGLVAPGKAVTAVTLRRAFSAGQYDLKIKISPYDARTQAPLNSAVVKTPLVVQ